jgi:hypothetical protein
MAARSADPNSPARTSTALDADLVEAIRQHLPHVLASEPFRSTKRCRAFLEYVIARVLEGREDLLKERTIGAEIFERPADYETAIDPIVRVKATEVRKRLAQYYQSTGQTEPVRISLPSGAYVPVLEWKDEAPEALPEPHADPLSAALPAERPRRWRWIVPIAAVIALAGAAVPFFVTAPFRSDFDKFWAPIMDSPRPVLVSLGRYRAYELSPRMLEALETARRNPDNPPMFRLEPSDVVVAANEHVSKFVMQAALEFQQLFAVRGKATQFRVGSNVLIDELRDQPVICIGSFSNPQTLQITHNLRFGFEYDAKGPAWIVRDEQATNRRRWVLSSNYPRPLNQDYAIITRIFHPATHRVFLSPAGLNGFGTEAAADFLTHPEYWKDLARIAPAGWQNKNFQIVLETQIIGDHPSPPEIVATHFW